jgi:polar amino acid transport system substrate-binding protein
MRRLYVLGTKSFFRLLVFTCLSLMQLSTLAQAEVRHEPSEIKLVSFIDPPYVFDATNNQAGLVEVIIKTLFSRAKINYKLQLMPKKRAIINARHSENTCVFPIERNQEREAFFSWMSPIVVSTTGLFQVEERPHKNKIITLIDAHTHRIGSHLGSATGEYLSSIGFNVDTVPKNSANIFKLNAGRIDLWESDILTAEYISKTNGIRIAPSEINFFTQLKALACNLTIPNTVIKTIRKELYEMYHDGTVDTIYRNFKAK